MNSSLEALFSAIHLGTWSEKFNRPGYSKPGAVIERMNPESRSLLSQLRSEDIANIRPRIWEMMDHEWPDSFPKEHVEKLLLNFDKKILK